MVALAVVDTSVVPRLLAGLVTPGAPPVVVDGPLGVLGGQPVRDSGSLPTSGALAMAVSRGIAEGASGAPKAVGSGAETTRARTSPVGAMLPYARSP